jgi:hypothetical protein
MNENVSLNVITANYDATVETKLLAGDLDVAYETPDGAQAHFAAGLTQDVKDITADFPTGRILWNASDEVAAIQKGYPSFVDTMTSLQGNLVALPYYQSCFGTPLANNQLLQAAKLANSPTDSTNYPNSYSELYAQMPTIAKSGAASTPLIPLWYEAFPGWGIPHQFIGEAGARFGYNKELFSPRPAFTPLFDTNTGVADMLTDWMNLWSNNYVPHGILTLSSDGDVDGLFETGKFAYALWWQYNLKVYNNPSVSKIAGYVNPVPNGSGSNGNNWGYTVQQVYLMRKIQNNPSLLERAQAAMVWFTWKDRTQFPYEPLRIASQADIAAFTAYIDINESPLVTQAFQSAVPDPTTQVPEMIQIQQQSTYNQIIPAPWADSWMIDLSSELPKYLTGEQNQATTITNIRNKAEQLISSASSSTA